MTETAPAPPAPTGGSDDGGGHGPGFVDCRGQWQPLDETDAGDRKGPAC